MLSKLTLAFTLVFNCITLSSGAYLAAQDDRLPNEEKLCIENAYRLWQHYGEKIWPGWTEIQMPMIYITSDHEFAIGFPKAPAGFGEYSWKYNGFATYVRARELPPGLAASFPFQGIPAVVIGSYKTHETTPARWSLTAVHEMFHVLQMHRGSVEKVSSLRIVEDENDGTWQLNYPFPYGDADVMRLFHLVGYPTYLAATQNRRETEKSKSDIRYNIGTALDATKVLQAFLKQATGDDRAFRYAQFQQWKEGIARYTEYRIAEMAATGDFVPGEDLRGVDGFETYEHTWRNHYQSQLFQARHAGRVSRSRNEFYNLGLAIGVALDNSGLEWKDAYFTPGIWLEDLLATAAGSATTLKALAIGDAAPDFELLSLSGDTFKLSGRTTDFVLVDFWQPWCPPCVESFAQLKTIQDQHAKQLSIVGVVDRCKDIDQLKAVCENENIGWPTLTDDSAAVALKYGIEGYPHLFLVDANGKVAWKHKGTLGEEAIETLEKLLSSR